MGEHDPRLQAIKRVVPWFIWKIRFRGEPAITKGAVWWDFRHTPDVIHSPQGEQLSPRPVCHIDNEIAQFDPRREVYLFVDPGEVYAVCAGHWVTLEQERLDLKDARGRPVMVNMPGLVIFDECHIPHGHFDMVRKQLLDKPWWPKVVGSYHDRATKQHHNNRSQEELWRLPVEQGGLGIPVYYNNAGVGIQQGIDLMHRWLYQPLTGEPLIYFNGEHCPETIKEYKQERYPKDTPHGQQALPIDKHNHHRKALTYGIYYQHGDVLQLEQAVINKAMQPTSFGAWATPGF